MDVSGCRSCPPSHRFGETTQALRASVAQTQAAEITLVTAEGDRVTLSANSEFEASFETYNARGRSHGHGGPRHAQAWHEEVRQKNDVSLSVEGNLNASELEDIRRAVDALQRSAEALLEGDSDEAAASLSALGGLGTISGIDATIQVTRQVSIEAADLRVDQGPPRSSHLAPPPSLDKQPSDENSIARLIPQLPDPYAKDGSKAGESSAAKSASGSEGTQPAVAAAKRA